MNEPRYLGCYDFKTCSAQINRAMPSIPEFLPYAEIWLE
jgi:hypothetical protein